MAQFVKKLRAFWKTPAGRVISAVAYALMLTLIVVYFTGNGEFIYEAF